MTILKPTDYFYFKTYSDTANCWLKELFCFKNTTQIPAVSLSIPRMSGNTFPQTTSQGVSSKLISMIVILHNCICMNCSQQNCRANSEIQALHCIPINTNLHFAKAPLPFATSRFILQETLAMKPIGLLKLPPQAHLQSSMRTFRRASTKLTCNHFDNIGTLWFFFFLPL